MNTLIEPARILEYIRDLLPWAHSHQIKAIATIVVAIIKKTDLNLPRFRRHLGYVLC